MSHNEHLFFFLFLPAPTRATVAPTVPAVGERISKSKIIPDQARALANALKQAVVKPLKKTMMTKKKSLDSNTLVEQQLVHSLSTPTPLIHENSDNLLNEISVDSIESPSPTALTPPPAKPPRHNDESASSSSTDIAAPPPAKPPRHFSLYSQDNDEGLIQQTDNVVKKVLNLVDTFGIVNENDQDMNILRQTSPPSIYIQQASNSIELEQIEKVDRSPNEQTQISSTTDSPVSIQTFDEIESSNATVPFPISLNDFSLTSIEPTTLSEDNDVAPAEIKQLATNLAENIFHDVEKEFEKQEKYTRNLPQSVALTHPSTTQSSSRPLTFVTHDSGLNATKSFSPLIDIVTTKTTPKITTSVTVISPPQPELSSSTTATALHINSDDEDQLNSTSTLMPNSSIASDRSKFLQTSSKESSIDSNDTNPYETMPLQQQTNTGSATPARSLISDYDNLHGSYGSLVDDAQQPQPIQPPATIPENDPSVPTTAASSMSTIYESMDTLPSSSTLTYVTAPSTIHNDNTSESDTTHRRLNSDISDEDLVESFDVETPVLTSGNPLRSSKGRFASHHINNN